MPTRCRRSLCVLLLVALASAAPVAQSVTSPRQFFGHDIGADYQLPNYRQLAEYWQRLDRESDRLRVVEIGRTAEGRAQLMAIVTSPDNHRRLERYKEIARRLALAEDLDEAQARALAREGRAVVWIDGGLHATEVLGAQQLMETVYQLVSRTDPETTRILDDVIVLAVHANPDGHDLVADWYMREPVPERRSTAGIPRLYQKYVGHDNNRDFYLSSQPETTNMNRILFREWFPQIVYNHHQTGPAGAVMFAPPFRDPFNYVFDPLVPVQIDMVGAAMHSRFEAEGKPGVVTRRAASYSTWWNGGLRTTVYFHNMIGLLTETIGNPTPIEIPLVPDRLLPDSNQFYPITPQRWRFRQSIDYSVTANYAVLDYASRYRETLLFNIYRMGRNSIERGSRDHWTITPDKIERLKAAIARGESGGERGPRAGGRGAGAAPAKYFEVLRDHALRDPRGYVIPADQPDFPTAVKFVNALIKTGVTVHRARERFSVGGRDYPAGSFVVLTAQAFRP
ncbi:MAG TPA: M14 metallopeptidase family protein, partial [Vicinamibacterales bacterium]|nr:M14 metallopeptidase family protein [Vicinamibacterales bacterium]